MTDDIATLTSERDALRQRVNELENEVTIECIAKTCARLKEQGVNAPYIAKTAIGDFSIMPVDKSAAAKECDKLKEEVDRLRAELSIANRDARVWELRARSLDAQRTFLLPGHTGDAAKLSLRIQLYAVELTKWGAVFTFKPDSLEELYRERKQKRTRVSSLEMREAAKVKPDSTPNADTHEQREPAPTRPTATWHIDPIKEGGFILVLGKNTVAEIAPFGRLGWYRFTAMNGDLSIRGESGLGILHVLNKCERIVGITCDRSAIAHLLPQTSDEKTLIWREYGGYLIGDVDQFRMAVITPPKNDDNFYQILVLGSMKNDWHFATDPNLALDTAERIVGKLHNIASFDRSAIAHLLSPPESALSASRSLS